MALKEKKNTYFSFCSDTLFKEDFSLRKFTERFFEVQNNDKESNLVLSYQCKDEGERKSRTMTQFHRQGLDKARIRP